MSAFRKLEKFNECKYPSFIKFVLKFCGFEEESTLLLINEETIKKIEEEVTKNKQLIAKTVYEKNTQADEEFRFLIGHKDLILNIPKTLKDSVKSKKSKKQLDVEVVADDLLERVNAYLESKNFTCEVKKEHMQLISLNDDLCSATCTLKCIFCKATVKCTFDNKWSISNYPAHLRKHPEATSEGKSGEKQDEQTAETPETAPTHFQRGNSAVLYDVESIVTSTRTSIVR